MISSKNKTREPERHAGVICDFLLRNNECKGKGRRDFSQRPKLILSAPRDPKRAIVAEDTPAPREANEAANRSA
jgi:hypothetical protein